MIRKLWDMQNCMLDNVKCRTQCTAPQKSHVIQAHQKNHTVNYFEVSFNFECKFWHNHINNDFLLCQIVILVPPVFLISLIVLLINQLNKDPLLLQILFVVHAHWKPIHFLRIKQHCQGHSLKPLNVHSTGFDYINFKCLINSKYALLTSSLIRTLSELITRSGLPALKLNTLSIVSQHGLSICYM